MQSIRRKTVTSPSSGAQSLINSERDVTVLLRIDCILFMIGIHSVFFLSQRLRVEVSESIGIGLFPANAVTGDTFENFRYI